MHVRLSALILFVLVPAVFVACDTKEKMTEAFKEVASAQAIASAASEGKMKANVTGTMHTEGGDLAKADLTFDDCQSGELDGFYGVDFYVAGDDGMRMRYVHDEASGDVIKVPVPPENTKLRIFGHQTKCAVLDGHLEKTNVSTWTPKGKIRHLNGHVKFDCSDETQAHVTGEVTFSHCAVPRRTK